MDTANTQEFKKHIRTYVLIFVALLALTIVTVTISSFHLSVPAAITVALIIATIKGSLVACYFMHLISEKKLIFLALIITVIFFIALMWLPIFTNSDPIIMKHVS